MTQLTLHIQTPKEHFIHEELVAIQLPGQSGVVGLYPNYAPMVIHLKSGILHARRDKKSKHYFINPGIARIFENTCTILTEDSQKLREIDPSLLEEQLNTYHDDLSNLEEDHKRRFIEREIMLARSMIQALSQK